MKNFILISFLFVVLNFQLYSCRSLRDVKLQAYPGFESNAEKYTLLTPVAPVTGDNTYIFENKILNKTFDLNIDLQEKQTDVDVIDTEEDDKAIKTKTQEFTSYIFQVDNPMDSSIYKVVGKTTYFCTREDEKKSMFEVGHYVYPLDFWIYDEGKDAGKISVLEKGRIENKVISTPLQIMFHGIEYHIEYQNMLNKVTISFEDSTGLVALIGLKPKSNITTKLKGDILLNRDLSSAVKCDICCLYLMVEAVLARI